MSISNIHMKRYIAFWKPIGRVVAITPVKPQDDAARWENEACDETIWVHKCHARMTTYERARLMRLWYVMRLWRVRMLVS